MRRMKKEILIGGNSDLIVERIRHELGSVVEGLSVDVLRDFSAINSLAEGQLVIIDVSVYTVGMIERMELFKSKFPEIELIAVTYCNDVWVDRMLLRKGIDQVMSIEELPEIVSRQLSQFKKAC